MKPMDLSWRLLKVDDEIPDYSDYPVDQCEMCDKYLHDSDYHVLNDHNFCSDCYNQLAEPEEFDPDFQSKLTGESMDLAWRLLKSEVLLWPKRFDNRHWMMEKPGPGGYTLRDKQGKSKAFVSLPNLTGDYGKGVHSMTDEELQNAFLETDTHETMHEALGNIGEDYDKPLHNEYPAMVAEYLQYARRPREQIPSQDKVSQLLDEGMDDREIAMQIAQRMAPMHQQVSPGHNIGNIARVVTGSPNESYDDIQTGEPMDIAFQLLKEDAFDADEEMRIKNEMLQYKFPSAGPYWSLNERQKEIADVIMTLPKGPGAEAYLSSEGWEGDEFDHLFAEGHETVPDYEYEQLKMALAYFGHHIQDHMADPNSDKSFDFLDESNSDHPEHPWAMARNRAGQMVGVGNEFSERFQDTRKSEPMDIAMRLLKENNFFDNMRAKRKRGEKPAKPGDEDYPSKDQWKDITAKSKKPDPRLKAAGVSGYNKPKRTPNHPKKSHVVVARSGGKTKTIRFGQQGKSGAGANPKTKKEKARQKSFKARHAKNIKRGPMSAAYWADKVKW